MSRLLTLPELREAMVRDYKRGYLMAGMRESEAKSVAEARAIAELAIVDAARANGDIVENSAKRPKERPADRPDVVAQQFAREGLARPSGETLRFRSFHARPQSVSERWGYAVARVRRILEGSGGASTFEQGTKNATMPKLAKEFSDLYGYWLTMFAPPPPMGTVDPNPFRGLSAKDASRKFIRLVEDICDRSTGVLGSWYVK